MMQKKKHIVKQGFEFKNDHANSTMHQDNKYKLQFNSHCTFPLLVKERLRERMYIEVVKKVKP
jgi:hypothetical protein